MTIAILFDFCHVNQPSICLGSDIDLQASLDNWIQARQTGVSRLGREDLKEIWGTQCSWWAAESATAIGQKSVPT